MMQPVNDDDLKRTIHIMNREVGLSRNCSATSVEVQRNNLVLSTQSIMQIGHHKEFIKQTFRHLL